MKRFLYPLLICWPLILAAVEPDEILDDPALETRARAISADLRCVVCQGENIDASDAGVARDLRRFVRERLLAGDDDAAVIDAVVARYGEFVLLDPALSSRNAPLWLFGPIAFLIGGFFAYRFIKSQGELADDENNH